MAGSNETVNSIIGQVAYDELDKYLSKLDAVVTKIIDINKLSIKVEGNMSGAGSIQDITNQQEQLVAVTKQVTAAVKELQQTEKQSAAAKDQLTKNTNALARETEKAAAAQRREAKEIAELTNDYKLLSKAYTEAALRAKNYQLQMGAQHPVALQAIADANKLGDQLKALDASVGQYQRNVGNYGSAFNGLGNSVQQILREAPSAVNSISTFFLAISNNLPQLFDEMERVKESLKGLKEQAAAANEALIAQQAVQNGAAAAAQEAEASLGDQVEAIASTVSASAEQAAALKETILGEVAAAGATAENAAAVAANTEALAINAGASAEEAAALGRQAAATVEATAVSIQATAAMEAQAIATAEANAAAAAQPSVMKRILASLFSINSLLTLGVLLLTAFGAEAAKAVGGLFKFKKGLDESKKSLRDSKEALDSYSKALQSTDYSNAVTSINELRINVGLAKQGFIDKDKVMRQYNETIGKVTGEVKRFDEIETELTKHGDAYIQMTLLKAAANIALQEAAKKAYDAEAARLKPQDEFQTNSDLFLSALGNDPNGEGQNTDQIIRERKYAAEQRKQEAIQEANDARKLQEQIAKDFQARAAELAKNNGFDLFGGQFDAPKVKKKIDHSLEEYQKALEAFNKTVQEYRIGLITPNPEEMKEAARRIQQSIEQGNLKVELDATLKIKEDAVERALKDLEAETNRNLLGVENSYQAGLYKSFADYEKARTKVVEDAANEQSRIRIAAMHNMLTFIPENSQEYKDLQAKIDKAELDRITTLNDKKLEIEKQTAEKRKAVLQELHDKEVALGKEVLGAYFDFQTARIENEVNGNSRRIDEIDRNKDKEIAGINQLALSAEEKENRIAVAEGRAQIERERLEEKNRKLRREAAKYDKEENIANIISETALAVIRALGKKPYGADNIYLAEVTAGIGAVQLARAIAAPLPEYFDGTGPGGHIGGLAVVGDGGQAEPYLLPDGRIGITPNTPTIMDLPKGTHVFPSIDDFIRMTYGMGWNGVGVMKPYKEDDQMGGQMVQKLDEIRKAVQKQKGANIAISVNDLKYLNMKINN